MWFPPLPGTFLEEFYNSITFAPTSFIPDLDRRAAANPARAHALYIRRDSLRILLRAAIRRKDGRLLVDPWGKKLEALPFRNRSARSFGMRGGDSTACRRGLRSTGCRLATARQHDDGAAPDGAARPQRETVRTFLSPLAGGGRGSGRMPSPPMPTTPPTYCCRGTIPKGPNVSRRERRGGAAYRQGAGSGGVERPSRNGVDLSRQGEFAELDRPTNPSRIRLNATAVSVRHEGRPRARSLFGSSTQKREALQCEGRAAIIAGGVDCETHRDRSAGGAPGGIQSVLSCSLPDGESLLRNWRLPV